MSRYRVAYKPGGAIAKPLEIALKMQRAPVVVEQTVAAATTVSPVVCTPAPTGIFWMDAGVFDSTMVTAYGEDVGLTKILYPFAYFARVEGELCGRGDDVVISYSWEWTLGAPDAAYMPYVWTDGNIFIVSFTVSGSIPAGIAGVLTVIAKLDGTQIGDPITLVITWASGY